LISIEPAKPHNSFPLAETIEGIRATNSRAFGNEVVSALMTGLTSQLARDLDEQKKEVARLRERIDDLLQKLGEKRTEVGILNERLEAFLQIRHLRNFGIAAGTALVTGSISFMDRKEFVDVAWFVLGIGALLMLAGWFKPVKGGGK